MALDKCTRAHQEMEQKILKKAKEMEKEQMVQSYANGEADAIKTFKQQEQ
jgi:hypothetical protein